MKKIFSLVVLSATSALLACGQTPDSSTPQTQAPNITPQIANGVESKPHSRPYATLVGVPIINKGHIERFWCGGVLISKEWVMTAGECVKRWKAEDFVIRVGVHDRKAEPHQGEQLSVLKRILHPKAGKTPWKTGYNIGLLKLSKPVSDPNAIPVNLPSDRIDSILTQHNARAIIMGWGSTVDDTSKSSSPVLREANIPISPTDACLHPTEENSSRKPANSICQLPEDGKAPCREDGGGPLVQTHQGKTYVLGMPSHGYKCDSGKGYSVSIRVNSHLNWIKSHTGIDAEKQDKDNKPIFIGHHHNLAHSSQDTINLSFSERKQAKTMPENAKTIIIRTANLGSDADKAIFDMTVSTKQNKNICEVTVRGDSKTFCRVKASEADSLQVQYKRHPDTPKYNTLITSYLVETE